LAGIRRLALSVASMRRSTATTHPDISLPQPNGCAHPAAWPASAGWRWADAPRRTSRPAILSWRAPPAGAAHPIRATLPVRGIRRSVRRTRGCPVYPASFEW